MTLNIERDLDNVKLNQLARCLAEKWFHFKVVSSGGT